ncbi:PREDICTED: zinc finger protein 676-like [Odobenus rosmarus divergens]|uniref:Zinc finger protein 676-like n=1 Tax=Odobenus rosmarus divergens TaxID=9708 RepID=A0A9B0H337_ODORO
MWDKGRRVQAGLIVSKPDLVSFLEQKKEPWDVKRKKTVAIHRAISSHDIQSFMPKPSIEASFQKVSMGRHKNSDIEDLHLMIDRDNDGKSEGYQRYHEGHIQTQTTAHNKNLTVQNGERYKTFWKTSPFKSAVSKNQCDSASEISNQIFKHTYLGKDSLENLESYLVHAESNYLNHSDKRIGLTVQSNVSENQKFKNEEPSAKWDPFERSFTEESTLQNYQSIFNGDRIAQSIESEETFKQSSNDDKHLRTHFPGNHYECNKCGEVFYQNSNLIIHKSMNMGENPYNKYVNTLTQSSSVGDHQRIHVGKNPFGCEKPGNMLSQSSGLNTPKTIHTGEKSYIFKECGKDFDWHSALPQHQGMHTGEKPYGCEECGKTFKIWKHIQQFGDHLGDVAPPPSLWWLS